MNATFHVEVGGKERARLVVREGDRTVGSLKVTGQGVTWHAGSDTHAFSWKGWLRMIEERKAQ